MIDYQCVFCFTRLFEKLLEQHAIPQEQKFQLAENFISFMDKTDFAQPTPLIAREIHHHIREILNNPDPYKALKKRSNETILKMIPELKGKITSAVTPFDTAIRLAVAGNIIDFGPGTKFSIQETIRKVLVADFAIDHSIDLMEDLEDARNVLYLGDNAGEILLDKLFIEKVRPKNVTYVVRSSPVINDVTMEDVVYSGMDKVAKVVENGYDAPATIIEKGSKEFLEVYKKADLIISKGQGNFEGLADNMEKNIYFLFMVKCNPIARQIGAKKGDCVVMNNYIMNQNKKITEGELNYGFPD